MMLPIRQLLISHTPRRSPISLADLFRFGFFTLLLLSLTAIADAQDKRAEVQLRTVHGSTVDKDDNPVPASVVYLLNLRTQSIITRITDDSGNYRFSGLDPNVDYEVHAEHGDSASATRTISSFDSRRDIEVVLKLSRKKAAH